jgi:hypothetical protein
MRAHPVPVAALLPAVSVPVPLAPGARRYADATPSSAVVWSPWQSVQLSVLFLFVAQFMVVAMLLVIVP